MSDASLGVTNPGYRPGDTATALPAGIALGASFNPALARAGGRDGRPRGAQPRASTCMLAGGINLARDPRNGRNFEYLSEDPLLSAVLAARVDRRHPGRGRDLDDQALLAQLQRDQPPLARRDHRPGRAPRVRPAGLRDRDRARAARLGHDAATTRSTATTPAATAHLLEDVLKGAWGYPGWVMSDWGATPSWEFALAGLDQESGAADRRDDVAGRGRSPSRCATAHADGELPQRAPVGDGAAHPALDVRGRHRRVGRPAPEVDMAAHNEIALETARQGIVLLEERRRPAARRRHDRAHRGDRRLRPARRAGRHRLERGRPARRLRGRDRRSAAPGSWAARATCTCCRRRRWRSCSKLLPERRDRVRPRA